MMFKMHIDDQTNVQEKQFCYYDGKEKRSKINPVWCEQQLINTFQAHVLSMHECKLIPPK